jgi:glutamate 5-kinase
MHSKLDAVRTAAISGSHVVIAPARARGVVARVLEGEDLGTLFFAPTQRLRQRKHWIAYTLRPRGTAIVDNGAAAAIQSAGRSILCVGVLGVRGHFVVGDAISIASADGTEIARGLARLSATDAARLAGAPKPDGSELLVHRDDLVVLPA